MVAMTFVDQTIVSVAAPDIQKDLRLSSTGVQEAVNAYLLALTSLFVFGGRLADTVGHRKTAVLGVVTFGAASALCGLTPKGGIAETWIVSARAVQGAGAAIMFPTALAIVVRAFALRERGKALALFFAIAGGLASCGPLLGGYLAEWTWRSIFWVNIPFAVVAVILIAVSPSTAGSRPAHLDYRGLMLIVCGIGLSVFGFQQSSVWGLASPATMACVAVGVSLLVAFCVLEMRTPSPLIQLRIFGTRAFLVENLVLGIAMIAYVPVSFFASEYAQIALGMSPTAAGIYILVFFAGFMLAAQIGGHLLDRIGAKHPVVLGCFLSAVGFWRWAGTVTGLHLGPQEPYILLAGAGLGLMLGPASTDAVNHAHKYAYGEATGISQTIRNYAASLGLAILGTVLVAEMHSRVSGSLISRGVSVTRAHAWASRLSELDAATKSAVMPRFERLDFAYATSTVLSLMAAVMTLAAFVALVALRGGVAQIHMSALNPEESASTE
jgi:EmrB/QacA subfamily drug resistance transporter